MNRREFLIGLAATTALQPIPALTAQDATTTTAFIGSRLSASEVEIIYNRISKYFDSIYVFSGGDEASARKNVLSSPEVFAEALERNPMLASIECGFEEC